MVAYGRLVARAFLGGSVRQSERREYRLITASFGFGKDLRKGSGTRAKGSGYGDDACFVATHRLADVLDSPQEHWVLTFELPSIGLGKYPKDVLENPLLELPRFHWGSVYEGQRDPKPFPPVLSAANKVFHCTLLGLSSLSHMCCTLSTRGAAFGDSTVI
ncbi:hypothetical protein scyTo_0008617 [Scyliorhinus torazame]|uniref:Uncharacterized protein n=1 Tax=Scyliorhinus torazame TaxID=75743 RepID=A0A401PBT4_SCYTO|nr:hypothetical protein [Scyliorhinus torazame]